MNSQHYYKFYAGRNFLSILILWGLLSVLQAAPISVSNSGFEDATPADVKVYFNNPGDNIPGWSQDSPTTDSGVEQISPYAGLDRCWGYSSEGPIYQLLDHLIADGTTYTLSFAGANTGANTSITASFYYLTNPADPTTRVVIASGSFTTGAWQIYDLNFTAQSGQSYLSQKLGVQFQGSDGWYGIDEVSVSETGGSANELVLHYAFDNPSTTEVIDSSASGFNGTLASGAEKVTDPTFLTGKVLSLAGNYVDIGRTNLATPWTAALWVQRNTNTSGSAALLDSSNTSLRLEQWNNTKKVGFTVYGSQDYMFDYSAPLDTWVHLVFVGTGSGVELYVNGQSSQTINTSITCPMEMIGSNGADAIHARIEDLQIYTKALTPAEIADVFEGAPMAALPDPTEGTRWVPLRPLLQWSPGTGADSQTLYYGMQLDTSGKLVSPENAGNYTTVASGDLTTSGSYQMPLLDRNTTHYWQVDTTYNGLGTVEGTLWSFTTTPCPVSDLDDDCDVDVDDLAAMMAQWLDAYGGNGHPDDCADFIGDDGVRLEDFSVFAFDWMFSLPRLEGWFAATDERYAQDQLPQTAGLSSWSQTAWKGERLNAQIALWSEIGANNVTVSVSDLTDGGAGVISASNIKPQFVGYVLADDGGNGCSSNMSRPVSLVPDVLDIAPQVNIAPQNTQPIWITLDVPTQTPAGNYSGTVTVTDGATALNFTLNVEVLSRTLPAPANWAFHLDLWQNPWSVARYHNVTLWSQQHLDLLEPLMTMLGNAGQKCITTTLVNRAWGGQTYDPYGTMVEWTKHTGGTWSYDFSIFDQYVQLCDSIGITEQINCYSMVPWGNNFEYYDEASSSYRTLSAAPGSTAYNDHWAPFLQAFRTHLIAQGWLNRTAIAMDERDLASMLAVIALRDANAPELKIAMAGHYNASIDADIDDFCYWIGDVNSGTPAIARTRTGRGQFTTFYTMCGHHTNGPNNFTYSPPAEQAWLGWYAAKMDMSGFLRWAYNSWVVDPLVDSRHTAFQAGDTFQVYPGARSSIRFEQLRDGIEDYEKIRILKQTLTGSDLTQLQNTLDAITYGQVPYADQLNTARTEITELSR